MAMNEDSAQDVHVDTLVPKVGHSWLDALDTWLDTLGWTLSSNHLKNCSPNQHLEPWTLKQTINRQKVLDALATALGAATPYASGFLLAKRFLLIGLQLQLRPSLRLQRLRQPFLSSKKSWAQRPSSWALLKAPSIPCQFMPFENLLMSWLLAQPPYKAGC